MRSLSRLLPVRHAARPRRGATGPDDPALVRPVAPRRNAAATIGPGAVAVSADHRAPRPDAAFRGGTGDADAAAAGALRPAPRSDPARDPAPSRWAYRMQRLWLTPAFREALRTGLPIAVLALAVVAWLADPRNLEAIGARIDAVVNAIADRPEFRVALLTVEGASPDLAADVREVLSLDLPVSSFDLDLEAIRDAVEALDPVARAEVRIRSGGVLAVILAERVPALVWRTRAGLELLDATGTHVAHLPQRRLRADLPVIAGDAADGAAAEALAIFEAAGPIRADVRGLVRVGERRWDLVMADGLVLQLPEAGAVAAVERAVVLAQTQDLLNRDILRVDLRDPSRTVVRLTDAALAELHRMRAIERGEDDR